MTHNLPRQLTSFVGREREVAEVSRLLASVPLVTLTGSGGSGKTRLALRVAEDLVSQYPDGVWWVDLAGLSDPGLVPQAVASLFALPDSRDRSLTETLISFLSPKSLLLVLDTCEHLLAACARLAHDLLRNCRHLTILATSRERLAVPGEVTFEVPVLSTPDPDRLPPPDHLAEYESVQLFVERAAARQPGFQVTPSNAKAIAEVCRRLDGMPLAIELAATRYPALSVDQIAARLSERFNLLKANSAVTLPRHQTLLAAIDWSYGLLTDPERIFFRRISVFAGGFTLEATERVCGFSEVSDQLLDVLTHLVDKSLVVPQEQAGDARYRLLDTIRDYGRDLLKESPEHEEVHRRHRDFYLNLAEEAERGFWSSSQQAWIDRMEPEYDNLRAAFEWTNEEDGSTDALLRLAVALSPFWAHRGRFAEGLQWTNEALARGGWTIARARARALVAPVYLEVRQGDWNRAMERCQEGLAIARDIGDKSVMAQALHSMGMLATEKGDFDLAAACCEEAIGYRREIGDRRSLAATLNNLGEVMRLRGDPHLDRASVFYEESLALFLECGYKHGVAVALNNLGHIARERGDYARAISYYEKSLTMLRELRFWLLVEQLAGLALIALAVGQPDRAAKIAGAAEGVHETFGAQPLVRERAMIESIVTRARAELGDAAFQTAWLAGRAGPIELVIEDALALDPGRAPTLIVKMLGGFEVLRGPVAIPPTAWRRKRDRLLLAYLVIAGAPVPRESLLDALWPDLTPASAGASLNVSWSNLKKAIEPNLQEGQNSRYLFIEGTRYAIRRALIATDVREFDGRVAAAEKASTSDERLAHLEAVVQLYRGDLLPDDANEPWTVVERERLRSAHLNALEQVAEGRAQQGRPREAVDALRLVLHLEPWREEAYRSMMRLLAGMGRRSEALRLYRQCEELLRRELSVSPGPETAAVFEAIAAGRPIN